MPEQFENPEVIKLEDQTVSKVAADRSGLSVLPKKQQRRPSRTEQNYDQDHEIISK
jgi:hypothetical protein